MKPGNRWEAKLLKMVLIPAGDIHLLTDKRELL